MPITPRENQEEFVAESSAAEGVQTRAQSARDAARRQSFDANRGMGESNDANMLLVLRQMMEEQARRQEEQARRQEEQARQMMEEQARRQEEQARRQEEQARLMMEEQAQTRRMMEEQARRQEEQAHQMMEEQARRIGEKLGDLKIQVEKKIENLESDMDCKFSKQDKRILGLEQEMQCLKTKGVVTTVAPSGNLKVPPFDGTSSWGAYKIQFETVAESNGWNDDQAVTALMLGLRGEALDVLEVMTGKVTLTRLLDALESRYGDSNLEPVYRAQLRERAQRPSESLQEWGLEIEKLVRKAYASLPDVADKILVQTFIDGIRDREVRISVNLGHHKNLKDALAHALEVEAIRKDSRPYRIRAVTEKPNSCQRGPTCYLCGEVGHMRFSCPKKDFRGDVKVRRGNTLVIDGVVNGTKCDLTLDTGASRTVIRYQLLKSFYGSPSRGIVQLVTATGQRITDRGEGIATFKIGGRFYRHKVVLADIVDDCIIGLDFMKLYNCKIDLEKGIFKCGEQEVCLKGHSTNSGFDVCRVINVDGQASNQQEWKVTETYEEALSRQLSKAEEQLNKLSDMISTHERELRRSSDVSQQHCEKVNKQDGREIGHVRILRTDTIRSDWGGKLMQIAQQEDCDIKPILDWMKSSAVKPQWSKVASTSTTTKSYWAQWDSLVLHNGVLCRKLKNAQGDHLQIVVPRSKVRDILEMFHTDLSSGHLGVKRTLMKIKEIFYWIHYREDVEDWIKKCKDCAAIKDSQTRSPWERITVNESDDARDEHV
ncbi:unnamed protein product [Pieris macdunnoughi]|uniref:CCHC-type domain-containing protein n=1 Tax=Pieris macdunnoughi TaxID=345717 RepID=A0A821M1L5_9NEOP|nr:unnamed protein product [Pieris macdunnoughi]